MAQETLHTTKHVTERLESHVSKKLLFSPVNDLRAYVLYFEFDNIPEEGSFNLAIRNIVHY